MFVILCLFICYSCSQPKYSVCIPTVHPDSIKTQMIPIAVGNKWYYEETGKYSPQNKIYVEISSLDTVTINRNGLTIQTLAYNLKFLNTKTSPSNVFYYLKCSDKTVLMTANFENKNTIVKYLNEIIENPIIGSYDSINPSSKWKNNERIKTDFGELECYVQQQLSKNISMINSNELKGSDAEKAKLWNEMKTYYSKGIGLIRVDQINRYGEVIYRRELKKYEIKK